MKTNYRSLLLSSAIALSLVAGSGAVLAGDPSDVANDRQDSRIFNASEASDAHMDARMSTTPEAANAGQHGRTSTSVEVANARQEGSISTTYALSPYLRNNDIQVSVNAGTATLTGKVPEDANRELAEQIALRADGVTRVDNQITVVDDYEAPMRGSERSYAQHIDDAGITTAVKSKLLWSRTADGIDASVETESGRVVLTGTAPSNEAKTEATSLATHTRGVVAVDNQLRIETDSDAMASSSPDEDGVLDQAGEAISDSWITMKVKSTLMYSSNVSSNDVSVSTSDGVVTLTGKIDSGAERALAIGLAENVKGVKRVQSSGLTLIAAR